MCRCVFVDQMTAIIIKLGSLVETAFGREMTPVDTIESPSSAKPLLDDEQWFVNEPVDELKEFEQQQLLKATHKTENFYKRIEYLKVDYITSFKELEFVRDKTIYFKVGKGSELMSLNEDGLPKLIVQPDDLLNELRHINLGTPVEGDTYIQDYEQYKKLKWDYLVHQVQASALHFPSSTKYEFKIVAFAGLITTLLKTEPTGGKRDEWKIEAWKNGDMIFLRKFRHANDSGNQNGNEHHMAGIKFNQLSVAVNAEHLPVNEYEKCFEVFGTTFDGNYLVLLNEYNASTVDGKQVKLAMSKPWIRDNDENFFYKRKLVELRANALVCNSSQIVIGVRNEEGKLANVVNIRDVKYSDEFFNVDKSNDFLSRFFKFLRGKIEDAADNQRYCFELYSFRNERKVKCRLMASDESAEP